MSKRSPALRVPCPRCRAASGAECVTSRGRTTVTHQVRWAAVSSRMRRDEYVVRILHDDERFGVCAGDEYVAVTYWLNPEKVTLLRRIPDGYDPMCNRYRRDVAWLRWAS